jgi:chaperonin 10 Kd subunit
MIEPLHNYYLVKTEKEPDIKKTETGILLVEEAKIIKRPKKGEVVAVGPDAKYAIVGKTVRFPETSGLDIDENLILLKEIDILAIED